jgi:manganese/iron transport system permease protein
MFDAFEAPFMQRALVESLLLAALAGVLGSWIVLRRLAFFTHGVGTAAFPGLVVAGPAGVAPQLTALAAALLYAGGVEGLRRTRRVATDAATGLVLVGALALGVVLASDVYETGAGVDRLLFGSLIGLSDRDLWLTAVVAAGALLLEGVLRRSWLAQGFDPATARALGVRPALADALLMVAIAAAAVVALDAVGALLVTAVLVIPAATVRLVATSVGTLQVGTAALAAVEGVAGLWLAYELNVGPGPATAVLGGAVFALVAVLR